MKKNFILALPLIFCLMFAGCSVNEKEGGTLKIEDVYGTYEGWGSATKYEVERTETDVKNQRYLFITGDARESQEKFDGIVITFQEYEEGIILYENKNTGLGGELAYNADTGQWEYKADYPLGSVSTSVVFIKEADGTNATFTFTQTFEREHYENPQASDGVNEFTLNLTKIK